VYAPPLPSCSLMCPAYEVTAHEVTAYEVTAYVCSEYVVPPLMSPSTVYVAACRHRSSLVLTAASAVVRHVDSPMPGQPACISGP
jgi:hypothetical protein